MSGYERLRRGLLLLAGVLILGLAASLAFRLYAAHRFDSAAARFEREMGSLDLATFVRPDLGDDDNAVTWIGPGVAAVVLFSGDQGLVGSLREKAPADWTAGERAKLTAIVERNAPAIALLDRARGITRTSWEIPYRDGTTAKLPNLLAGINAAKLLRARAQLAMLRGDRETAVGMAEDLGVMARSYEVEPVVIVIMIGDAIERLQHAVVRDLIASPELSAAEIARLSASLPDVDLVKSLEASFRFEAAGIARAVRSDTFLEQSGSIPRFVAVAIADLAAAAALESDLKLRGAVGQPVTSPLPQQRSDGPGPAWWRTLVYGPNTANTSARIVATASSRDLARLALALRAESLASGAYPSGLPAAPGVAPSDPLTGGPRSYTRHDDGSVELASTTTPEVLRSIFPTPPIVNEPLFRWSLPAPPARANRSAVLH